MRNPDDFKIVIQEGGKTKFSFCMRDIETLRENSRIIEQLKFLQSLHHAISFLNNVKRNVTEQIKIDLSMEFDLYINAFKIDINKIDHLISHIENNKYKKEIM